MRKNNQEKNIQIEVEHHTELLKFLLEKLDNRGRNTVKSILSRGQVSVNHQQSTQYNLPLVPGDTVVIEWQKLLPEDKPLGLEILYEDDDIIVIHKEAGLLSVAGGKEKDWTAHRQLIEYVRRSHPKNRVYVVHRLDQDTSGVMVFAKNEQAKKTLQDNWQEAVQERTYIGLVERQVKKKKDTITSWLKETKTLLMYSNPTPNGGQKAITHYEVLKSTNAYSLLAIHLETGRKNQIRVHMKDIGHPIVGDKKYGSKVNSIGRLGLHAHALAFIHPTSGELRRFESPIPSVFLRFFK